MQIFFVCSSTIVLLVINMVRCKKNNGLAEYLGQEKVKNRKAYHEATDISDSCKDNLYLKCYLPFHTGVSDADVRYLTAISNESAPYDCHITYTTPSDPENLGIVIVIEFTDSDVNNLHVCDSPNNEVILTSHSEYSNVCKNITLDKRKRTNVFAKFLPEQDVILHLKLGAFYENIKITATSGKVLTSHSAAECDSELEVTCDVSDKTFCIDKGLQCDDNINCGSSTMYDEDHRLCAGDKYKRLWVIVLYSVIILIIAGFFVINILYTCVPHVADNFFIFNEHEDNRLIIICKSVIPSKNKKVVQEGSLFLGTPKRTRRRRKGSLMSNSSVFTFSSDWSSSDESIGNNKKTKSVETQKSKVAQKSAGTQKSHYIRKPTMPFNIGRAAFKKKTEFEPSKDKQAATKSANVDDNNIGVESTTKPSVKITPSHIDEKDTSKATGAAPPASGQESKPIKNDRLFASRDPSQLEHRTINPKQHAAKKTKTDPFRIPLHQFSGYVGTSKASLSKPKQHKTQSTMWKEKPMKK